MFGLGICFGLLGRGGGIVSFSLPRVWDVGGKYEGANGACRHVLYGAAEWCDVYRGIPEYQELLRLLRFLVREGQGLNWILTAYYVVQEAQTGSELGYCSQVSIPATQLPFTQPRRPLWLVFITSYLPLSYLPMEYPTIYRE